MNLRSRIRQVLQVLLLNFIVTAPHASAENVLALVPEDAFAFAVVNNLGATIAKIEKVGGRIGTQVPSPLLMFKTTESIEQGLNQEGDALLVMMPPANGPERPTLVMAVPVTDYEEFVSQFAGDASERIAELEIGDQELLVAKKGGFAVLTNAESKAALAAFLAREAKHAAEVAPLGEWLKSNQIAAVVLPGGIKAGMDKALTGLEQGRAVFQNMADNLQGQQAQQMQQMLQMMSAAAQFCEVAKEEVATFAVGARVDANENIFVSSRTQATAGGTFAEWTDSFEKREVNLLAGLPAGPFVFAGGAAVSEQAMEALIRWSFEMMKANPQMHGVELSKEDAEKMAEASMEAMKEVRAMSMSMSPGVGNEPLYDTMSVVLTVDDPASYVDHYKKAVLATAGLMKGPDGKPLMEMDVADVEVADVAALKVTMDMSRLLDSQAKAQGVPQMKALFDMMIGEGGKTQVFVVPIGEKTVVIRYGSEEKTAQAVKDIQDGVADLSQDAQVGHTIELLPAGAQGTLYVSPSGVVAMVERFMSMVTQATGQQAPLLAIPPFPEAPPFGCSLKVVSGRLETEEVVPGETLEALGAYVQQFE